MHFGNFSHAGLGGSAVRRGEGEEEGGRVARREKAGQKKALCGNRRPSNDCLPYEKSSKDRC